MDLIAKIRAAIDEDERVALAATPGPWHVANSIDFEGVVVHGPDTIKWAGIDSKTGLWVEHLGPVEVVEEDTENGPTVGRVDAEHMVRHDPTRVLRQAAALRKILELHQRIAGDPHYDHPDTCTECGTSIYDRNGQQRTSQRSWPCPTLLALADIYGIDHP
jgi:hypothetical protein